MSPNTAFAAIVALGGVVCGIIGDGFPENDPMSSPTAVMFVAIWVAWGVRHFMRR